MKVCPNCGSNEFEVVETVTHRGKINEEEDKLEVTFIASKVEKIFCLSCIAEVFDVLEEANVEVEFC